MTTVEQAPPPRPQFLTVAECTAWLATLPAGQPVQAQAQCIRQFNLLHPQAIDAKERLAIIETARPTVLQLQVEASRRFAHRPLPLSETERAGYEATRNLWQALLSSYLLCLESTTIDPAVPIERALATLAEMQLDTYRAGYSPTADHWRQVHALYASAERSGFASHPVADLRAGKHATTTVTATYAELLLLHAASPYELPARHLHWASRWARRWAAKVVVTTERPGRDSPIYPLCLDLGLAEPAGYPRREGPRVRWLDTTALRASLKKRIHLLEQGATPASLQLGDDCQQPACSQLLRQLYQRWCKGGAIREQDRRRVEGRCEVVGGMEAVHYYLAGRKPFRQPGHASDDTLRRERDEIATFGHIAALHEDNFTREQGFQIDEWQVVEEWHLRDESAAGIHVTHVPAEINTRVGTGQLLGVRLMDAKTMQLGVLRWTNIGTDGLVHGGILVIPGRPDPVSVHSTDPAAIREPYRQAFVLPAVPALACPASIILPVGWFKPERILDLVDDGHRKVRLLQVIHRGVDFDQASYEVTV
jgi:cyclic-di-GMP-binding protein